ncbi:MAG: prolipoprotein diacylglyceryl transferase [Tissierellia bacterium]|nr:prolipoprotein diacylglyceryl transferase [Tissierellia bacterium]
MDPIAFTIFGLEVRWYGILIASAVVIGTILAIKEAKRKGISEDTILDLLLFVLPAAIIGARLHYVLFSWDNYKNNLIEILNIRGGGLAIHGAVIAGVIVGLIFAKVKKISFWELADIIAPSLILGQSIGRWGNYANQEAYGGPTDLPWAIVVDGVKVHPTFLYESIWNLLVFLFLVYYSRKMIKEDGEVFLLYIIIYSIGRLFIEGLRTDSLMFGPFRIAQLLSLASIIIGAFIFYKRRKKSI